MTKLTIFKTLLQQLQHELDTITAAARRSFSTATSSAHHAEGKYDTFSLETSYLARGQAKRVEEIRVALEKLHAMPLKTLGPDEPVQLSALVQLGSHDGQKRRYFFGAAGGGETVKIDSEEIVVVTAKSPLGRAMLGHTVGQHVTITLAGQQQTFTIITIE